MTLESGVSCVCTGRRSELMVCVPLSPDKPPEDDTVLEKAFQYSEERSRSIEINYENMDGDKILTKVNFHMDPAVSDRCVCDWSQHFISQSELREEVVEKVKWQINRDSAEDKLRDFLDWMYALKEDTLHHVSLL